MWLQSVLVYMLTISLVIFTSIYLYFKYIYTYWSKKNVPFVKPEFPFGNMRPVFTLTDSFGACFQNIYLELKQKNKSFAGFYMLSQPAIMLIDPELIKNVLTKDFAYFHDRGMHLDEDSDPLNANLVSLKGLRWKNSRAKITPTFTSGKMKMMFQIMQSTCNELTKVIEQHIDENKALDTRDVFARLTTDTIGSCAFGLNCNSLQDPDVDFRKYGNKVFEFDFRDAVVNMLATICPSLLKTLKIPLTSPDITEFFMNILKQTIDYREKNNIHRKDFLDLLIRLKNNQSVLDDQMESKITTEGISFNELAAHAFVFFAAGFETTSSALDFCLFELVNNLEIPEKLRKEVFDVLKEHDNEFSYGAIMEMKYLDKVVNEVLRKYPPIPMVARECTSDYKIPGTDFVIKKGVPVFASSLGLQRDPEHYPNPDKFDPENFSDEKKDKRHPYTYLPFGEGPRVCIGMRFALLQIKLVLATIMKNYSFTLDAKTVTPIIFSPRSIFLRPKDSIFIQASRI